jgi:hypothetical protein
MCTQWYLWKNIRIQGLKTWRWTWIISYWYTIVLKLNNVQNNTWKQSFFHQRKPNICIINTVKQHVLFSSFWYDKYLIKTLVDRSRYPFDWWKFSISVLQNVPRFLYSLGPKIFTFKKKLKFIFNCTTYWWSESRFLSQNMGKIYSYIVTFLQCITTQETYLHDLHECVWQHLEIFYITCFVDDKSAFYMLMSMVIANQHRFVICI